MRTPLPRHLPAQSGALSGHILTEDEMCEMDRITALRRIYRGQIVTLQLPPAGYARRMN